MKALLQAWGNMHGGVRRFATDFWAYHMEAEVRLFKHALVTDLGG